MKNFIVQSNFISGFPITCRAPSTTILAGANGIISSADAQTLASACVSKNYRGIMVWYGSVSNGFAYGAGEDTSNDAASQQAYINAMNTLRSASG